MSLITKTKLGLSPPLQPWPPHELPWPPLALASGRSSIQPRALPDPPQSRVHARPCHWSPERHHRLITVGWLSQPLLLVARAPWSAYSRTKATCGYDQAPSCLTDPSPTADEPPAAGSVELRRLPCSILRPGISC
jgi:hypothetical protein